MSIGFNEAHVNVAGIDYKIPVNYHSIGLYQRLGENQKALEKEGANYNILFTRIFAIMEHVVARTNQKAKEYGSNVTEIVTLENIRHNIAEYLTVTELGEFNDRSQALQDTTDRIIQLYRVRLEILVPEDALASVVPIFENIPLHVNDFTSMRNFFLDLEAYSKVSKGNVLQPGDVKKNTIP